MSIPVLKLVCAHFHLKVGGNRDDLVGRIVQGSTVPPSPVAPMAVSTAPVAPMAVSTAPVVLRSPMSPEAPVEVSTAPVVLCSPMSPEAPEAPTPPPEMVALVEEMAGRTTDELPEAPSVDEPEAESAQDKLRRDLQNILNKHQDSDGEEEEGEARWGDMDEEGDEMLVEEDYI